VTYWIIHLANLLKEKKETKANLLKKTRSHWEIKLDCVLLRDAHCPFEFSLTYFEAIWVGRAKLNKLTGSIIMSKMKVTQSYF